MRAQDWKGLITDASPYALPPGAAIEQINLQAHVPGQLTTRPGMRRMTGDALIDIYPYAVGGAGGQRYLIGINSSGQLRAQAYALAASPGVPATPPITPGNNQIRSNYLGQLQASGGESAPVPYTVPAAPSITYVGSNDYAVWTTPANGGAPLTGYKIYENGSVVETGSSWATMSQSSSFTVGALLEVSAINPAGEGPKSAPYTVPET